MCRILNKATWQIIECTNHTSLDSQSKDIVICLESDYIIESKLTNTNTNTNTNTENIMSVLPTTTTSLLERSKLALESYKQGLILTNKLEALEAKIRETEIKLDAHINNIESTQIINIQEIKDQIEERSEYLEALNNEISKYEKDVVSDVVSPSDKEILEKSFSISSIEEECEINEEYSKEREINLDNLTTEFKELVNKLQVRSDGCLGRDPKDLVVTFIKENAEWAYHRREEILDFLDETGKIYDYYMKLIKEAIPLEWKDEYMPF
jgi:hypothetical protein